MLMKEKGVTIIVTVGAEKVNGEGREIAQSYQERGKALS
jgi:hypothetical protein